MHWGVRQVPEVTHLGSFVMSLNFSGFRVIWFTHSQRVFSGIPAQRRRCDGGRVWRGTVHGLFATAEKFPELWRPELSQERSCVICGCSVAEMSFSTTRRLLSHLFHSICSSRNRKLVRQAHPSPAQPCVLIFLLPVTPHPWDSKVSFARAAKKCQVALFDLVCPFPRAGLWLPLLN